MLGLISKHLLSLLVWRSRNFVWRIDRHKKKKCRIRVFSANFNFQSMCFEWTNIFWTGNKDLIFGTCAACPLVCKVKYWLVLIIFKWSEGIFEKKLLLADIFVFSLSHSKLLHTLKLSFLTGQSRKLDLAQTSVRISFLSRQILNQYFVFILSFRFFWGAIELSNRGYFI